MKVFLCWLGIHILEKNGDFDDDDFFITWRECRCGKKVRK